MTIFGAYGNNLSLLSSRYLFAFLIQYGAGQYLSSADGQDNYSLDNLLVSQFFETRRLIYFVPSRTLRRARTLNAKFSELLTEVQPSSYDR